MRRSETPRVIPARVGATMGRANLVLRFLLELAALAALAAWGWQTGSGPAAAVALAVLTPLTVGLLWAACVSPKAPLRLSAPVRLAIELGLFALAGLALLQAGARGWAAGLAAALALHQAGRLLQRRGRG